jgi:hypothetical protein
MAMRKDGESGRWGDGERRDRRVSPSPHHPISPSIALALALLAALGCRKELQTEYGQRQGPGASQSVNGTAVFAEMFEAAGHKVSSWTKLSPRLDQADCIVWFPDDFNPPSADVVNWLERWLNARPNRTLIYVGRDFSAAPWYWRKMQAKAPADQAEDVAEARADAEASFQRLRPAANSQANCRWFTIKYEGHSGPASNITSDDLDWKQDLDAAKLEIESNSRVSPLDLDTLLGSDQGMIIGRQNFNDQQSRLFVVSNGSFLLNAMLVNHEHRKLAGKLIDAAGPSGQDVVFLESGRLETDSPPPPSPGPSPLPSEPNDGVKAKLPPLSDRNPPISDDDLPPQPPTGLELLLVWPTNWVLLHFAMIGVLFCLWKLPIFGLPRPEDPQRASDFGRHVDAVAALLKRADDPRYAKMRIEHYQQVVKKSE